MKTTEQGYINGCYTRYGTRPLILMEIKTSKTLSNGMYAVAGKIPEDGISVDVYENGRMDKLIFMEHGITSFGNTCLDDVFGLAELRCAEMKL